MYSRKKAGAGGQGQGQEQGQSGDDNGSARYLAAPMQPHGGGRQQLHHGRGVEPPRRQHRRHRRSPVPARPCPCPWGRGCDSSAGGGGGSGSGLGGAFGQLRGEDGAVLGHPVDGEVAGAALLRLWERQRVDEVHLR